VRVALKERVASLAYRPALLGLYSRPHVEGEGKLGRSGRMIMLLSLVLVDAVAAQIAYFGAEP
jgi:hypothetical protein